jgi:hypothetical protein
MNQTLSIPGPFSGECLLHLLWTEMQLLPHDKKQSSPLFPSLMCLLSRLEGLLHIQRSRKGPSGSVHLSTQP